MQSVLITFIFLKYLPCISETGQNVLYFALVYGAQFSLQIFSLRDKILFCKIIFSKDQTVYPTQETRRQCQGDPSACFTVKGCPSWGTSHLMGHVWRQWPGLPADFCTAAAFFCLEPRRKHLGKLPGTGKATGAEKGPEQR